MNESFGPPRPAAQAWYPLPAAPPSAGGSGRGLAIASFVLSALALVGVLAVGAWVIFVGPGGGSGASVPLTGQLPRSAAGAALAGSDLSVTARVRQDGGDVADMTCPRTPKVGQGVVTVCHGVISGSDYAVVVYFETADGRFTLEPV